jgi:hypothetical protein
MLSCKITTLLIVIAFWFPECNSQTNDESSKPNKMNDNIYSEPMGLNQFWSIIEMSRKKGTSKKEQLSFLQTILSELTEKEIVGFRLQTDKLLFDSYSSELWCAAYIINGGCSDDGFQYFRCWLISLGEKAYTESLSNPDNLIKYASVNDYENEFEEFWYVSNKTYELITKKNLYDVIDTDFKYSENKYPAIKFNWEEDKPESMKKICPELFQKFWK